MHPQEFRGEAGPQKPARVDQERDSTDSPIRIRR